MDVYFVRHGETDGNVARRHQHPETSLNERGIVQAEAAAYEVSTLKPTHIITSTQLRAVETTKIIDAYCEDVIPEAHPAFEELKRPDWLIGNRFTSMTTVWYIWSWFFKKTTEGGESYTDLLARVKEARLHLESLPSDARVVVVSHAVFINIFLEHICTDKPMSFWRALKRFWFVLTIRNASIVHLEYTPKRPEEKGKCGWKYISATRVYQKS